MSNIRQESLAHSYNATMDDMQHELSRSEKIWSKIMHAAGIEAVVVFFSATIFRPRSLLIGGFTAAVTLLATYLLAKLHGYVPSGSEPLIGFAVGWAGALLYDGIQSLFRRNKKY